MLVFVKIDLALPNHFLASIFNVLIDSCLSVFGMWIRYFGQELRLVLYFGLQRNLYS